MSEWSPVTLTVCMVCDLVFALVVMAACTYVVFWLDQSGWWYLLALFIAGGWSCKSYRSPDQIKADTKPE